MENISIVDTNDILLLVVYYPPVKVAEEVACEVEVGEESHFQFPEKVTSYNGGISLFQKEIQTTILPVIHNWVFKKTLTYSCDVS